MQQQRQPKKSWGKLPKLSSTARVTICTPTYNRRPFIPFLIKCILAQTYPLHLLEWVVVDDGTDLIGDVIADHSAALSAAHITVKYVNAVKDLPAATKLTLGQKRNLMHKYATGDVIVYMDDDDYYPPERVKHAVQMLRSDQKAWAAGASEMHIYFKHLARMYQFGPYGPAHATAATFAFRKELLEHTQYNETASVAEEREFLRGYTVPFVQLDTRHTILVFSHMHNSFDKRALLADFGRSPNIAYSKYGVDSFIPVSSDPVIKQFYMVDIDNILAGYNPGAIEFKPDVIKNIEEIKEKRAQAEKDAAAGIQKELEMAAVVAKIMAARLPELPERKRPGGLVALAAYGANPSPAFKRSHL